MKNRFLLTFLLATILSVFVCDYAYSDIININLEQMARTAATSSDGTLNEPIYNLIKNVYQVAKDINYASSQMQKFGDMLMCASLHGSAADWYVDLWVTELRIGRIIEPLLWLASLIFICIGFVISIVASYYLFDIAFNLSVTMSLIPIAIALWPFGWTKGKLKEVLDSVVFYIGLFMFLPLGILIANKLVEYIVVQELGQDMESLFSRDNSDLLSKKLGLLSMGFLKLLLTYLVAFKIIPLFACEFCNHFFGSAMVGSPISEKIQEATQNLKKHTVGRATNFAKDAAKHKMGKSIEKMGDKNGNALQRAVASYGKEMSKINTKKGKK